MNSKVKMKRNKKIFDLGKMKICQDELDYCEKYEIFSIIYGFSFCREINKYFFCLCLKSRNDV